jgi:hypothetical protein
MWIARSCKSTLRFLKTGDGFEGIRKNLGVVDKFFEWRRVNGRVVVALGRGVADRENSVEGKRRRPDLQEDPGGYSLCSQAETAK